MEKKLFKFGHIFEPNGMQGFAILAAIAFYAGVPFFKVGFIGVDIFFVISGFLITALLIKEYVRYVYISLKNFYLRKILRLGTTLILLLLIFSVSSFIFYVNRN